MKKALSLLLALVMLLGMMPMQVFAIEPEQPAPEKDVISILGDSISTFAGYLPEGNATYYPTSTVKNVADTWWMQLITELDACLGVNESWSGSYVSETANNRLAMATLERIEHLDDNGTPDVIIFFGGTNDIAYKRPLGSFDPASAPEQADLSATAWESLADGYTEAILRMRHCYPEARIISILPTINRTYYNNATLEQHNAVLRAICSHYGVEYVDLVAAGFTAAMLGDATHPNAAGMDLITAAVKQVLQPAHSHSYTASVTEPTCTERGYTTYTCTCGDSYVSDYVDATGVHTYENGICTGCGAAQHQSVIITRQPVPAAAAIGEKATVSVEAAGNGLNYQWYYRDNCSAAFTRSTVKGNTYTLTVKAANAARELYCVITDAQGNQVTTDTVRLLQPLAEELKIVTQPASAYALIGEKATVTMEVQGIGLSYRWYYRDLPGGSLTKSTITTPDYSITVKPAYVNRELYCVITDAHGNQVTTETVKLLLPLRESLEIVEQPVSSFAAIGETATVSVEANGEGLTYQWYFRNTPNGALSKSSITGSSYSVTVTKSNAQRVVYCVITDGHGNQVTTDTVALRTDAPAEEPKIYFASLSDALTGTAGSASPEGAVARVDKESDETVITLLSDTNLTGSLTVMEDIVLDLNGFTVSSDIFPMIHVKSGTCSLQNGSILLTSDGSGTTSAPAVAITVDSGAGLVASKTTVTVTDAANSTVIGISTAAGSTLVLTETDVTVTTGKSLNNAGIHTKGTAVLTECSVIAESDYTGANGDYTSSSKGILAEDDLELYNCYVWGAHSGVNTLGNLYVDGGTYEGYGHGGIYISSEGSTNYIYNATIRWASMRAGTVADSVAGTNHSAMYIGSASNITTYFDGCTFSANRSSNKSYCIVLRNSSGESNNCVYVSNSSFKNYNGYAYRSNNAPAERRLFAYSGIGNTYATKKVFQYARNGFYTEESYAQIVAMKEASVKPSQTVNIGESVT